MAFAVACGQRQRDTFDANRRVAVAGGDEYFTQQAIGWRVAGNEPTPGGAQEVAGRENSMAGSVGMNDARVRVDEEHSGAQTVEGVGKSCGFRLVKIDYTGDQHRAANM